MDERTAEFRSRAADAYGIDIDIHTLPEGTQTAEDAATSVGCPVTDVVSSIVFSTDTLVVAVVRGADRVDTRKLATLRGVHEAHIADSDDINEVLGWPIGGVPPFCHDSPVPVYVDKQVLDQDTVWTAAGDPTAVFPITPENLVEYADATVVDITE